MGTEERFIEAIDEDEEEEEIHTLDRRSSRHDRLEQKNKTAINRFLGRNKRVYNVGIIPRYYGELLAWALRRYLEKEEWQVTETLGYHSREPIYTDANTDYNQRENLLMDGQLLVQKGEDRFILTVDINMRFRNSVLVEGPAQKEKQIGSFITGIMAIAKDQNFYRGKKIEFAGRLRFLDVKDRSWDSIVIDEVIKAEIGANTVGFLKQSEKWSKYGIPLKRGILLAGEPGTGKTVICKALMAENDGITCVTTNGYTLDDDDYITELYELAKDLSPCIVFIEDIDLIGQNRMEFGYQRGSALLSLLSVMDGVEEQREIVTIATTNCLETLDKALSERPSRFDRVIKLSRPSFEQRRKLICCLCKKIPLSEETQEYIAMKAENCSPAQLQEIIFSLVIQSPDEQSGLTVDKSEIDRAISRIIEKNRNRIGFTGNGNHNGSKPDLTTTIKLG